MSPIRMKAVVAGAYKALDLECPKCHTKRIVAPGGAGESVVCEVCGALIPKAPQGQPRVVSEGRKRPRTAG